MFRSIAFAAALLLAPAAAFAQDSYHPGSPVSDANQYPVNTVVRSAAADRGASVGTTAVTLMAANTVRRGYAIQVQSGSASCYVNAQATATADFHSLLIGPGALYETPPNQVATGAVSIVCSAAATAVYAREF